MKGWLKLNWFKILKGIGTLIFIYSVVDSIAVRYAYNKAIKASDREIAEIKRDIKESDSRADEAIERAWIAEEEARIERAEKEKHKANVARIEEEKRGLEEKIAALPPTQIVVHTIKILRVKPEEITLQSQGVLFSLVAARKNLGVLEGFTLLQRQFDELSVAFVKSEVNGIKLLKANIEKTKALIEKDSQLLGWEKAEIEWDRKFNLSENRGKRNYWKGIKAGGIIGGIAAFFAGFFLGGK